MNRAITGFALILLLLLLTGSPAWAEDAAEDENSLSRHQFFYLAGGFSAGEYLEVEDDLEDVFASGGFSVKVKADETVGTDVRAGYRIHRNIAAELQFQWFSGADVKVEGIKVLELETWTFTGNLKGYLLTERMDAAMCGAVHPFLVAGVGLMHFDVKDKLGLGASGDGEDVAARFGGGIELYSSYGIGGYLDVTYLLTTGDVEGLDHVGLTLGVLFRF